ncbi:hypothetical protein QBC35DRAFT_436420 [Podospora australis]|uniref:Meiotic recombination protein DMC1 n=1 Tax=Podospora australis TaxID=1536484 RepID=A0AAN7AID1_9PEZI|nr:hypothetical protein QBC35DRAFT_436420 [Podospora australis]
MTSPENASSAGASSSTPLPGGFIPAQSLPSPAPSAASAAISSPLPHPRGRALKAGSAKEDKIRMYLSDRLFHINRRFVKKLGTQPALETEDITGYQSFSELCKDLESLINIIWLSGTPSLQIPYLLNIAADFNEWVRAFPASPTATFSILTKLDHCFASLLVGKDIDTNDPLPGFENGPRGGMSRTDMVRCKSTVQQTRVLVVDVLSKSDREEEEQEDWAEQDGENDDEDETDAGEQSGVDSSYGGTKKTGGGVWDDDEEQFYMDVARVYEHTLVKLGETLADGGGVGDIVEMSED